MNRVPSKNVNMTEYHPVYITFYIERDGGFCNIRLRI